MAKKKAKVATLNNLPVEKDDGTRWVVWNLDSDRPAYLPSGGLTKAQAERLSEGLVVNNEIRQITEMADEPV